ncbi:hypothetical protein QOT17_005862 [Balamuthia mandrillaris]
MPKPNDDAGMPSPTGGHKAQVLERAPTPSLSLSKKAYAVAEAQQIASQLAKELAEARNKANDPYHGRELAKQAFRAEVWGRQVVREVYAKVTDDELDVTRWKRYAQPFAPTCSCSQVVLSLELVNSLKP